MTFVGLFGALIVTPRPGNCAPCPRRYARDYYAQRRASTKPSHTALTKGMREPWASRGKHFHLARIFAPL